MDIDSALDKVGGYRRWHLTAFTLVGFSLFVPICFQGLIIVFSGWQPEHHCKVTDGRLLNESIPVEDDFKGGKTFSKCRMYVNSSTAADESKEISKCSEWDYPNNEYFTIIEQWDLVCDYNYLSELSQSLYLVGYLTSTLGLSFLIDKYGRKNIHIGSHFLICVIGVLVAFSNGFVMFVILRILLGILVVINCNSGITYLTEIFDSKRRAFAGIGMEFPWVGCYLLFTLGAYTITDWRTLQVVISLCSIVWIGLYWIIPESPIWLVSVGRYTEAEEVLRKMARWNKVKLDPNEKLLAYTPATKTAVSPSDSKKNSMKQCYFSLNDVNGNCKGEILTDEGTGRFVNSTPNIALFRSDNNLNGLGISKSIMSLEKIDTASIWILFKDRYLRKVLIICNMFWFGNCVLYYGLTLSTPSLGGNRFLNFLIMGLVELPAIFAAWYTADRYGRRISTTVYHIIAGIPLAIVVFIPETTSSGTNMTPLIITLTMISKFAITASFSIILLYTKELFPTIYRGSGSGLCQILGNIGTLVSPFANYLARTSLYWVPNMFFGVVSITVGLITLMLPETAKRPLPQTVEDLHMLFESKSKVINDKISKDKTIKIKGQEQSLITTEP